MEWVSSNQDAKYVGCDPKSKAGSEKNKIPRKIFDSNSHNFFQNGD